MIKPLQHDSSITSFLRFFVFIEKSELYLVKQNKV